MLSSNRKHFAITGGIGSGKSFVCGLLARRGIDVYDCDAAAKRLMASDQRLQQELQALVGEEVVVDGKLAKAVLAAYLLESEAHKQAINGVVHPAVARDFMASGKIWLESAILFDSGFDRRVAFDACVCVVAPLDVRLDRIVRRDGISREKALQWIGRQMPQEDVGRRCQWTIVNDGRQDLDQQIDRMLEELHADL